MEEGDVRLPPKVVGRRAMFMQQLDQTCSVVSRTRAVFSPSHSQLGHQGTHLCGVRYRLSEYFSSYQVQNECKQQSADKTEVKDKQKSVRKTEGVKAQAQGTIFTTLTQTYTCGFTMSQEQAKIYVQDMF
jgi:hypothetical protein